MFFDYVIVKGEVSITPISFHFVTYLMIIL
jgi:hypothetical protein